MLCATLTAWYWWVLVEYQSGSPITQSPWHPFPPLSSDLRLLSNALAYASASTATALSPRPRKPLRWEQLRDLLARMVVHTLVLYPAPTGMSRVLLLEILLMYEGYPTVYDLCTGWYASGYPVGTLLHW